MKLTTKDALSKYLSSIVVESVSIAEAELDKGEESKETEESIQKRIANDVSSLKVNDSANEKELEEKTHATVAQQGDEHDNLSASPSKHAPDITFSMIKDKLNVIRSGRSLRDDDIRGELKQYFKELSSAEQEALFVYLDSIAKIITAGLPNEDVDDPSDEPHGLDTDRTVDSEPHSEEPKRPEAQDVRRQTVKKVAKKTSLKAPIQVK